MDVSRLLIVSNRVAIPDRTGALAAGGLAVALGEAFRMYEGVWFGWSGKIAAEPASLPHVIDKGQVQYALMDLTTSDRREYYNGFANRAPVQVRHDERQERTAIEARREERLGRLPVERPSAEAMRLSPSICHERQQAPANAVESEGALAGARRLTNRAFDTLDDLGDWMIGQGAELTLSGATGVPECPLRSAFSAVCPTTSAR